VQLSHQVGAGGWLDWLPQETILFQGAALQRHSEINLAKDAGCLLLEAVVLGRAAMGETVTRLQFHDRRIIRRQGRVMWIEPLRLDDAVLAGSDRPALLAGARALASLVMVGPNLGDVLGPLRAVLDEPGVQAAASVFEGRLVVRLLAADGWPLRRQILRVLALLRQAPPPRVWQM
jgi:urease accessory protein